MEVVAIGKAEADDISYEAWLPFTDSATYDTGVDPRLLQLELDERDDASSLLRPGSAWKVDGVYDTADTADTAQLVLVSRDGRHVEVRTHTTLTEVPSVGERVFGPRVLLSRSGILGWNKVHVEFVPDYEGSAHTLPVQLPLLRLHCPKNDGCKAEYQFNASDEDVVQTTIEFLGIGGGGGETLTYQAKERWTTSEKRCIEVYVPAKLLLQLGTTLVNGTEVGYGLRAEVIEVEPLGKGDREIPIDEDTCQWGRDVVIGLPQLDGYDRTSGGADEVERTLVRKRHVEGKLGLKLDLGNVPLKAGLDFKHISSHEATIRTLLAPGARYVAYAPRHDAAPDEFFEACWTTK